MKGLATVRRWADWFLPIELPQKIEDAIVELTHSQA
jgi:hypothetical protein